MAYKICQRCVMDNQSDDSIVFDDNGNCNYCEAALQEINTTTYFPNAKGRKKLENMLQTIKEANRDKPFDCLMGISGGLDSSYLAYLGYKWGLRILAVHIDDGYDTEISKANIQKLCAAAHIDLRVIKPDQEQFNDLLLAYMKAGVPNLAIPQDNILFAFLYDTIRKEGIKYFLSGGNFALENILQKDGVFNSMDTLNIKDIHKKFAEKKMNKLKFISSYRKYFDQKTGKIIELRPLNWIDYNRDRAFQELSDFCGFTYYGKKHLENILTAFVQLYWLPGKFNYDKRRSHLSSMIVSGQMTREEALRELAEPLCDEQMMADYIRIIKENLGLSDIEFTALMQAETHQHEDYRVDRLAEFIRKLLFS